ncbi:rhodanese-like domain-containing protein [Agitococcus lubricus]|uniref:Rhodanese-related sulfurtransferase n=1 Tax=Agitococcus lubricus TaxID=1077255 RepID=A0A2T5J1D2_9GAMM|nr:rhodanese-like domain-containing protein [Agitococcus lubricus]PTQ90154.1 rhodanese-related sulfurtransferase [Agitococcus lubricus]
MIRESPITDFQPRPNDIIWDVRDANAYAEGHWQPAQHQALDSINRTVLQTVPSEQTIYVLCGGGTKAGRAAQLIASLDSQRSVVILTGGTRAAKAAGLPMVEGF